jgi:hypothetical protein
MSLYSSAPIDPGIASLQKLNKGEGSVEEYLKLIKDAFKAKAETLI